MKATFSVGPQVKDLEHPSLRSRPRGRGQKGALRKKVSNAVTYSAHCFSQGRGFQAIRRSYIFTVQHPDAEDGPRGCLIKPQLSARF